MATVDKNVKYYFISLRGIMSTSDADLDKIINDFTIAAQNNPTVDACENLQITQKRANECMNNMVNV